MLRFTLVRQTRRQYVLNRPAQTLRVTLQRRRLHFTLNRSTTVVNTGAPGSGPVLTTKTNYTHAQVVAASSWVIDHDLGYHPGGIQVIDSAGGQWWPLVDYVSLTRIILHFGSASFAGQAFLS